MIRIIKSDSRTCAIVNFIIFNNYNAEDDSLNTDYKSYIFTDFKAQLKPSDKTDALNAV